jgi:hypothetical protein
MIYCMGVKGKKKNKTTTMPNPSTSSTPYKSGREK